MKFSNHKNEVERQIIVLLVEDLFAAGYKLGVNDGEETTLENSTDEAKVFETMSTTDEDFILLSPNKDGEKGWIRLIYGNGCDVISDHSVNVPETVMTRALELAERFQ